MIYTVWVPQNSSIPREVSLETVNFLSILAKKWIIFGSPQNGSPPREVSLETVQKGSATPQQTHTDGRTSNLETPHSFLVRVDLDLN